MPTATPDKIINIGVVGYGYWGPNLVRNFAELNTARVHTVVDLNTAIERMDAGRHGNPDDDGLSGHAA